MMSPMFWDVAYLEEGQNFSTSVGNIAHPQEEENLITNTV